jgi:hypothetical protein
MKNTDGNTGTKTSTIILAGAAVVALGMLLTSEKGKVYTKKIVDKGNDLMDVLNKFSDFIKNVKEEVTSIKENISEISKDVKDIPAWANLESMENLN